MIYNIRLCPRHRARIKGGTNFNFSSAINVLVGPNGSGKSSLLEAIYTCNECNISADKDTKYRYFNSETMNPHLPYEQVKGITTSLIRVRAMFSSHGESMRDVLASMNFDVGDCLLLDEPETGHDLWWVLKIRRGLDDIVRKGCQIIAASHHPVFWKGVNIIELQKGYLHKTSKEFRKNI